MRFAVGEMGHRTAPPCDHESQPEVNIGAQLMVHVCCGASA